MIMYTTKFRCEASEANNNKKLDVTLPSQCYVPVLSVHLMWRHLMVSGHALVPAHVLRRVPRHRLMMHVRVMHHLHEPLPSGHKQTINIAICHQINTANFDCQLRRSVLYSLPLFNVTNK